MYLRDDIRIGPTVTALVEAQHGVAERLAELLPNTASTVDATQSNLEVAPTKGQG